MNYIKHFCRFLKKQNKNIKETIKEVKLNNFKITEKSKVGNVKIYRPTGDLGNNLYTQSEQNYLNSEIIYLGDKVDTLKNLEIRNEGGMLGFRVSLENLGNFTSNEGVVYNGSLLSKIGLTNNDIKFGINFDLTITLDNNISFTGNINLNFPSGDIINETEPLLELSDFNDIIFKRI